MGNFIQLHMLTSYPPANLNRDDMGRPKTAKMGGVDRLRISSQSLKRAWRTSEIFAKTIAAEHTIEIFPAAFTNGKFPPSSIGFRSKIFSCEWILAELLKAKIKDDVAEMWSKDLVRGLGQMEKDKNELSQLAQISDLEAQGMYYLVKELIAHLQNIQIQDKFKEIEELQETRKKKTKADEIKKVDDSIGAKITPELLKKGKTSVDIALFGRMLASTPAYNVEAACQVSHAISVHPVVIEDDYFTAVDDLNDGTKDSGSAHIGERGFAAALFYTYICIDAELLLNNLGKDTALTSKALCALIETVVKVSPEGMQNSHGSRTYASYVLAEKGSQQPRSLSVAFLKPITGSNVGEDAVKAIKKTCENMDKVYDLVSIPRKELNAFTGEGSLKDIIAFAVE